MRFLIFLALVFTSLPAFAQSDSLLTSVLWAEESTGKTNGYVLRLNEYGPFEEDAGDNNAEESRYLMGQWTTDSTLTRLTLAVDYFMGRSRVHNRYRDGQDYYLHYRILTLRPDLLELEDEITGDVRTFSARPIKDAPDAGERRAEKIELGTKKKGGLQLPKGW